MALEALPLRVRAANLKSEERPLETLLRDLRYGLRRLTKSPGTTFLAVLSLALGIGINTAIFSFINFALLRPLPVEDPGELVRIYTTTSDFAYGAHSHPGFRDLQEGTPALGDVVAERFTELSIAAGDEQPIRVWGMLVSGNYFQALGLTPAAGRLLRPEDDVAAGSGPLAVLAHDTWQRRFGGDPGVVGETLRVNGHPFTVVGVAPRGFQGTTVGVAPEVWLPVTMQPQAIPGSQRLEDRGRRWLTVVARLAEGTSLSQARSALEARAARLAERFPETDEGLGFNVVPLAQDNLPFQFRDRAELLLGLLMGVAGLVLLIACANLANLLLARAAARRTEISVRLAVGAGRSNLIRQLLTESVVLALLAGAAGLLLALWAVRILAGIELPGNLPVDTAVPLDLRVLGFTLLVSVLAGILFGLAPALHASRTDLVQSLKREEPVRRGGRLPLRSLLVIGQVAVCVVLLVAAGLFVRSIRASLDVDPGFETDHVLVGSLDLGLAGYDEERGRSFYRQLIERLESQPGIEAASLADAIPLEVGGQQQIRMEVPGYVPPADAGEPVIDFNVAAPGYFETLGIPLRRGRDFSLQDGEEPWVTVVNETLAERFWPGEDPLGRRMMVAGSIPVEVIGVVEDHRVASLGQAPEPFLYLSALQHYQSSLALHVRTAGDPLSTLPVVRREVRDLDANLPLSDVTTLRRHVRRSLLPLRVAAWMLGGFGVLALILASVGIYGLMTYSVRRRTRELGIRMAIGAGRSDVLGLVLKRGVLLVGLGAVIGLVLAALSTRFLSGLLIGVDSDDPVTFVVVTVLFLAIGSLATFVPAVRASRTEPMTILRQE